MKRFFIFFFVVLFAAPAFAADDVVATPSRAAITRSVAKPAPLPESDDDVVVRSGAATAPAATAATVSRRAVSSESINAREKVEAAAGNVGRSARTQSAGVNATPAARRAGVTLRPSTAEVGGRAVIAGTNLQTGSNVGNEARSVQTRAATTATKESIADAKERLESTADLNKSCQAQYNDCMDQFCSVIDANQKRCSCSANLSRYTKVEAAVKDANVQLNDVAQRIRYVGLSADEIRAIMSETEAETALTGSRDNTESRNMLDAIENLIKNPTSTTSVADSSGSSLDFDLDFSADSGADMFNLDFLNTGGSSSFSNLRGTELYNAAKKRCNAVLTQCKNVGATTTQITGNYDLAIDKDCIAYEAGLSKMNETLKGNVRSADQMLKKARLAVLENKNQYDAKGCIAALNTCMVDDMVCGADYEKCLDPTKKYIDENGKVVLGQRISDITMFMDGFDNSAVNSAYLKTVKNQSLANCDDSQGACTVRYLLEKIGTGKTAKDGGLCRAVLDKCQSYTYSSTGVYTPENDIVVNYIQRAMVNITAAQQRIISDYASSCMVDIATCYNQQVSQVNAWSSSASTASVYNVMRGACRSVALTCAYAVFASSQNLCPPDNAAAAADMCINSVSEMFYQSLLCPDNSRYTDTIGTEGYVNERCKCDTGYEVWGKACVAACAADGSQYRDSSNGNCITCPGNTSTSNGGPSTHPTYTQCRCPGSQTWNTSTSMCS